jgi:hypothetical protein
MKGYGKRKKNYGKSYTQKKRERKLAKKELPFNKNTKRLFDELLDSW